MHLLTAAHRESGRFLRGSQKYISISSVWIPRNFFVCCQQADTRQPRSREASEIDAVPGLRIRTQARPAKGAGLEDLDRMDQVGVESAVYSTKDDDT